MYSVVTSKGQITIPSKIRKQHKLMRGQRVSIAQTGEKTLNVEFPPTYEEITKSLRENLEKQGFTRKKLKEMALR